MQPYGVTHPNGVTHRLGMGATAVQASRGSIPSKLNEETV